MNLGMTDRVRPLVAVVREFIEQRVVPVEKVFLEQVAVGDRWEFTATQEQILHDLKLAARKAGLWNFWLTDSEIGPGLTTVEYAYLAEEMGRAHLAAEAFNCSAPDTGNMEVLLRYGSDEQKRLWLEPLLNGEIRSAFAMSEPGVASSDATNISTAARLEDGAWVIDGEKAWISGAGDPRCKILIVMARTHPDQPRHRQHSQILVPIDTPGVERVRPLTLYGTDDAPHGHMHLRFSAVRVPESNVLLGAGRGFEISQGRLGPGRVHHCMRALGMAEKALDLMCARAVGRKAFGQTLARLGGNYDTIARARIDLDMARLLTLRTAYEIDTGGVDAARAWISKIKATVPAIAVRIVDEAIQLHGAFGLSQDFPLASMYIGARALRLADGPDEVHRMVVARNVLQPYREAARSD